MDPTRLARPRSPRVLAASAAGFLFLAPGAIAQSMLFEVDGDLADVKFGFAVSGAGDVNGDGVPDLVVGAPSSNSGPLPYVRVLSGADGSVIHDFPGDSIGDGFGWNVSAGDVSGDGVPDIMVAAPWDDDNGTDSGTIRVYSGSDGSVLINLYGDYPGHLFGNVSEAGDVNGDGVVDILVGIPFDNTNGANAGAVRVYSGADPTVILHTFFGDAPGDELGESDGIDSAGDVNGDGFDDIIAGAARADPNGSQSGYAKVYSGFDGSVLHTFEGTSANDFLGDAVGGAGDVDGDGYDDVIVAAPYDDISGTNSGRVFVYSGLTGTLLHEFPGNAANNWFGASVAGAGDVNGDGYDDVFVGAPQNAKNDPGFARVFSGLDGSTIRTFKGDNNNDRFYVVGRSGNTSWGGGGHGDFDQDGFADLIVGAPRDNNNGSDSGLVRVFSVCDRQGTTYCSPAVANSTGLPAEIRACGSDAVAENRLSLSARQLPLHQFGYFLASETQDFVQGPGGSQGDLCLGGTIGRFTQQVRDSKLTGVFGIEVDLTNMPPPAQQAVLPGETWNFQAWYRDTNPGSTSNFTDAVSVLFQ